MEIIRMNKLENSGNGKTAAFFDFKTDEEITIKGFRLVSGSKGMFIASPSDKGKDGKYYESIILPQEIKNKLEKLAVNEYNK